ncbi:MAG: 2-dehydropantoate 2-reductase [Motiliproteus sp.]
MHYTQPLPPNQHRANRADEPWYILGAGAIGSLWACYLSLAGHQVRLILRDPVKLQHFSGQIRLSTPTRAQTREHTLSLQAELAHQRAPIQRLLVTTKSYDTLAAIDTISHRLSGSSLIVSLQNGMGQQQQLADRLAECAVYAGTTTEGAYRTPGQQLVHAGRGESWIGPINAAARALGPTALDSLWQLPLQTGYDDNILNRLWQKLAINAAINGLTAIHNCQNGELANNPAYLEQMQQLCGEVERLAAALKQPLFDRPLFDVALQVATATASNYSSMLQDVRNQRHTEIDFINGYICRQAKRLGIDTPYNQALVNRIGDLHPPSTEN